MRFEPNWASAPGATISRLMGFREIAFDDLADGLGLERDELVALIEGRARITEDVANALADHLGASPRFWLARDRTFVAEIARLAGSKAQDLASWSRALPLKSMREFGWLSASRGDRLYSELLTFFGCRSLSEWNARYSSGVGAVAFRTSFAYEADTLATLVWLRAGERQVEQLMLNRFNKVGFERSLPKLRKLSVFKHPKSFLPRLQAACHAFGVAVTTARAPTGCRASGASWVSKRGNPVIHLSFRHRSEDHFWFTFFHEAAHVILHGEEHIDIEGSDPAPFGSGTQEAEADALAQETLVPASVLESLLKSAPTSRNIIGAARAAGVTAGILVGQLEKAGVLPHGKMSFLKHRYRWEGDPHIPALS